MKRILFRISVLVAVLAIICVTYIIFNREDQLEEKPVELAQLNPNFPLSIRSLMSSVIRRSQVIDTYGDPNKSYDIQDYNYDLWELKDDSKLIAVYFNGSRLIHLCRFNSPLEKKEFVNIQVGITNYEVIQGIDPYAYLFKGDTVAISEHILADNVVLHIAYKQEGKHWVVDKMEFLDNLITFPNVYDIP
ncbi:MAG TPA: hypothetical protein VHP81_04370 [Lachnospiraceae bacterium]|nr:hypothetical protein [Lachnospiraceae bacterium]